jgi:MFS family permease
MAYIADITSEKDRSKGMGMIGAAFGLGFILGPSLGGIFAEVGKHLGTQPPFGQSFPAVIASLICFVNFLFAVKALPESRVPGGAARVLGGRFRRVFRAFQTPVLNVLILLLFLNTFALAHVEASLFMYMQDQFNWTLTQASFGFAYIGVIMVITQGYLIRKFMPKFGERKILFCGLVLSALGFFLSSLSQQISRGMPFLASALVMLLGLAIAFSIRKRIPEGGKAH